MSKPQQEHLLLKEIGLVVVEIARPLRYMTNITGTQSSDPEVKHAICLFVKLHLYFV